MFSDLINVVIGIIRKQYGLTVRLWREISNLGNRLQCLLVGEQTSIATMEVSVEMPQKAKIRSNTPLLGLYHKVFGILLKRYKSTHVHYLSTSNSQKLETA